MIQVKYQRFLAGAFASLASLSVLAGSASAQPAINKGGTLIYLEQQSHTNLYPPAGGFYPNGGVLNQITDKLTYQNPKTLEIEPWIAESWTVNADATEYTFKIRPGALSSRWAISSAFLTSRVKIACASLGCSPADLTVIGCAGSP